MQLISGNNEWGLLGTFCQEKSVGAVVTKKTSAWFGICPALTKKLVLRKRWESGTVWGMPLGEKWFCYMGSEKFERGYRDI